jgi:hypothetical protein
MNRIQRGNYTVALAVNATASAYTNPAPTITKPATVTTATAERAVFDLSMNEAGVILPNAVKVIPFGAGANDNTSNILLIGWHRVIPPSTTVQKVPLWVGNILCEIGIIYGSTTGVAGYQPAATDFLADTLTITTGTADQGLRITSPTGEQTASFLQEITGCELLEFQFKKGTATDTNCLFALISGIVW